MCQLVSYHSTGLQADGARTLTPMTMKAICHRRLSMFFVALNLSGQWQKQGHADAYDYEGNLSSPSFHVFRCFELVRTMAKARSRFADIDGQDQDSIIRSEPGKETLRKAADSQPRAHTKPEGSDAPTRCSPGRNSNCSKGERGAHRESGAVDNSQRQA